MSEMFDYITNGGDELAKTRASLEHALGCLEFELAEAEKYRAEIAGLRELLVTASNILQYSNDPSDQAFRHRIGVALEDHNR